MYLLKPQAKIQQIAHPHPKHRSHLLVHFGKTYSVYRYFCTQKHDRTDMNIEEARLYCLTKDASEECFPFDDTTLVFKVCGKMFAYIDMEKGDSINLKCDPDYALELRDAYYERIIPGIHMNKKHWNTCYFTRLDNKLMRSLIDHSYELVIRKFDRKTKEAYEHIRQEKQ